MFFSHFVIKSVITQYLDGILRSSHPEVFSGKNVLKICSKFTGEHPCRSVDSIKLLRNFIEITLWHRCSPVMLLDISRTPFLQSTFGRQLLTIIFRGGSRTAAHKELHLGCCSSPRSASDFLNLLNEQNYFLTYFKISFFNQRIMT